LKVAFPTEPPGGLDSKVSEHFSHAPWITIIDFEGAGYSLTSVDENSVATLERGSGPVLAKTLHEKGVEAVAVCSIGKGAESVLAAWGIQIVPTIKGLRVREAIPVVQRQVHSDY